jgi:hypothetical protein
VLSSEVCVPILLEYLGLLKTTVPDIQYHVRIFLIRYSQPFRWPIQRIFRKLLPNRDGPYYTPVTSRVLAVIANIDHFMTERNCCDLQDSTFVT